MPSEFDALVVGGGVAAAASAVALADSGRRVALVRPRQGPRPASGLVSGRALARAPPWARSLPIDRALVGRTVLLLDRESAVSLDYRDEAWVASAAPDGLVSGAVWAESLATAAAAKGTVLLGVESGAPIDRGAGGAVVGALGHTAALTLVEGAVDGTPNPPAPTWWTLRRSYTLAPDRVSARLAVAPGQGAFWECVLGFLPRTARGAGFLYPTTEGLTVGVTVRSLTGATAASVARETMDALVAHPAVAPLVSGSTPSEELLAPATLGGSLRAPEAGEGYLALCVPQGGGFSTVAGAPSVDRELARGVAAGTAIATALAAHAPSTAALRTYLPGLRAIERAAARGSLGVALNPRAPREYPALAASLLHELMHESGRPKESVTAAVRRVRKGSRRSWIRLGADALDLARSL